jgi:hypothetical protein
MAFFREEVHRDGDNGGGNFRVSRTDSGTTGVVATTL